ncbi:MAG: HAD hydrolase-like protein [Pikeienuella sp.]
MMTDSAHVFLDLDGTLTESGIGITRSVAHALRELGYRVPDQARLDSMIGPSLWEGFAALGLPDDQLDDAVALYRARTTGLFENRLYDGVADMLARLEGATLCLATAKPIAYAAKITAHFGIAPYMTHQFGSELDGTRSDKTDLIAHALARTGAAPARAVMVGDRSHDMIGALANGVTPVGAEWGYGSAAELRAAGCQHIAATPAQAADMILEILA